VKIASFSAEIGLAATQFGKDILQRATQPRPGVVSRRRRLVGIDKFVSVSDRRALSGWWAGSANQPQVVVSQKFARL